MQMSGLSKRPAFIAYHLFWNAVDWVFPPRCGGCDQLGERWCPTCQQETVRLSEPLCSCCGYPFASGGLCQDCRNQPPSFRALRSYCAYQGPAREAIHRLKYQRDMGIAEALAGHLAQLARDLAWPVDSITAVPLSPSRMKQRGYNQASLLAIPLALALKRPFDHRLLARTRETNSQVGLSMNDRKQNVAGAFTARETAAGKVIWVIDDVITTGATMNACAQALMTAGATAVYGLSFARALLGEHRVPSDPIL